MLISHVWNITRIQLQSWGEFLPGFTISTLQIGLQKQLKKSTLTVEWRVQNPEGKRGWNRRSLHLFIFPSIFCPFRFLSVTFLPAGSSLPSPGELPRARVLPGHCPWQVVARSCSRCTCPDRFTSPLEKSLEFCASILVSPEQKVQGTVPIAMAYWSLPVLLVNWVCSSTVARPPSPNHPQKVALSGISTFLKTLLHTTTLHLPTQQLCPSEMERRDPDSSKPQSHSCNF